MYIFDKNRNVWVLYNDKSDDSILFDDDFWYDLENSDIGEAVKEYVRNCDDFSKSIN